MVSYGFSSTKIERTSPKENTTFWAFLPIFWSIFMPNFKIFKDVGSSPRSGRVRCWVESNAGSSSMLSRVRCRVESDIASSLNGSVQTSGRVPNRVESEVGSNPMSGQSLR